MKNLPNISIVIPVYNGADYLDGCLQSLVDEDYPDLEIIVCDAGSKDGTVDIIKKFEDHITWWVSEPDQGQSDAINKGFARATGEIINWLCHDDRLEKGALHLVGKTFADHPETDVLVGSSRLEDLTSGTNSLWVPNPTWFDFMPCCNPCPQPSTYYRRSLLRKGEPLRLDLVFSMDFELWNYFKSCGAKFRFIKDVLSIYLLTGENKTNLAGMRVIDALDQIYRTYTAEPIPLSTAYRYTRLYIDRLRIYQDKPWIYTVTSPVFKVLSFLLNKFYGAKRVAFISGQWGYYLPRKTTAFTI